MSIEPKKSLEALKQALQAEIPGKAQKTRECMEEAFLVLEEGRLRKVPMEVLVARFNAAYDLKTTLPRFRQLLRAERNRRTPIQESAGEKK